jgi:N-acetylneuraminic acid mutarotase
VRRPSETQTRWLLLALVVVPGVLVALKVFTGVGPSLPGPRFREVLGVVEPFAPCTPRRGGVQVPDVPISSLAHAEWRRERDVRFFKDEELRAVTIDGVVYAGTAVRANEDGTVFSAVGTFYAYQPGADSARRLPSMPIAADHTAVAEWNGSIYVFGGFTRALASNRVWRFSPGTGRWQEMARLPRARGALAGAVIGNRFYAVGGASTALLRHPRVYRVLDVYDFRSDRWTKAPPMPSARHHLGAAAVGGRLYVVGGRSNRSLAMNAVERFDPATGKWEQLEPLPLGAGGLEAVSWDGRLIVLGGGDDGEARWVTPATWSFSPSTGTWSRLADMVVARHGFATAIADGRLYVMGGAPCARYGSTAAVESIALR